MKKIHGNIKCDCGHTQKNHFRQSGCCHGTSKKDSCGCTWFHPNVNYVRKKKASK